MAAGVSQGFAPNIDGINQGLDFDFARTAMSAALGGTASMISGGKFANGAITAAFARIFNDQMSARQALSEMKKYLSDSAQQLKGEITNAGPETLQGGVGAYAAQHILIYGTSMDGGLLFDASGNSCAYTSTCQRIGLGLGIEWGGVGSAAVSSDHLTPGITEVHGPYIDFVPGSGLSGGILYNSTTFSGGKGALAEGAMMGVGYQFCSIKVHACSN